MQCMECQATNTVCLGEEETESTVSFDFDQLPACHIPGSHRASISITGMSSYIASYSPVF